MSRSQRPPGTSSISQKALHSGIAAGVAVHWGSERVLEPALVALVALAGKLRESLPLEAFRRPDVSVPTAKRGKWNL